MIIVFLTRRFYPDVGGVETHVQNVSRELIKAGHQITIISELPIKKVITQKDNNLLESIKIIRLNFGKEGFSKKFRIWKALWNLRHVIHDADIVHCHDVFFWYLPFKFLFPNKKVYTTFHGYEMIFPPSKKAILVRKLSEKLSRGSICIGDYIAKWYGTKPDYVIYGGIENSSSQSQVSDKSNIDKLMLTLIGRLEKDIGVRTYLKTLENLKKEKINFGFKAYGEGKYKNKLEKYGKVRKFTDASNAIKDADIVFASSYLLILQALALRKIIIAVFENPLKEDYLKLSPYCKFIYICKDEKDIVSVVKSVTSQRWKSNSMLENGYKWAKVQTWEKVSSTYLKLWEK